MKRPNDWRKGHDRQVTLQHIKTGQVLHAPSIAAFCKAAKLRSKNAQLHISPILDGKRFTYRGWYRPELLSTPIALTDVFGVEVVKTFKELRSEFSAGTLKRLMDGGSIQGIFPKGHDFGAAILPKADRIIGYRFKAPRAEGQVGRCRIIETRTLKDAVDQLGLVNVSRAFQMVHGYRSSINGITFVGPITEERSRLAAL